jgi:hypothetical protein
MYIYSDQYEKDEQGIVNLTSVRVDYKKHLEDMLKVLYRIIITIITSLLFDQKAGVLTAISAAIRVRDVHQ